MHSWSSFVGPLALVLGLTWVSPNDARADVGRINYSVDPRAKGCPSSAEFVRDVQRQMGNLDQPSQVDLLPRVDVRIEAEAHEVRAYVNVYTDAADEMHEPDPPAEGRRRKTLRAPTHACRDLASAAAIVVSLMFRASADRHVPHAGSPPSPGPPADRERSSRSDAPVVAQPDIALPNSSRKAPPPSLPKTPTSPTRIRHALYAGALVGKTVVPEIGIGAIIGYGLTWGEARRLTFGLIAEASSTGSHLALARREGGVLVHSKGISFGPCLYQRQLMSCAAVTVGATTGVGTGVREPERRTLLLVEAGLRFGARIPLPPPFALRTELRVGAPVRRPSFSIERDTVWQAPAITILGSCSFETTF